jgi:hypothetical protein
VGNVSNLTPWPKGVSGNPGGRPKAAISGFAASIRQATKEGKLLWDFAVRVLEGKETTTAIGAAGEAIEIGPSIKDRLEAMKWLANRGFGRELTEQEIDTPRAPAGPPPSREQLVRMAKGEA